MLNFKVNYTKVSSVMTIKYLLFSEDTQFCHSNLRRLLICFYTYFTHISCRRVRTRLLTFFIIVYLIINLYSWSRLPICTIGRVTKSCVSGSVMLWHPNSSGAPNEGVPLYCRSGSWRSICNYNINCHTARVVCTQAGYIGAVG